jgi:hypothetical protein
VIRAWRRFASAAAVRNAAKVAFTDVNTTEIVSGESESPVVSGAGVRVGLSTIGIDSLLVAGIISLFQSPGNAFGMPRRSVLSLHYKPGRSALRKS